MQYYKQGLILGVLMIITGCATTPHEKIGRNPAIADKQFHDDFKGKTIKMVAPASGIHPDQIEALRSFAELNIQIPDNVIAQDIIFHSVNDKKRFQQLKSALYDRSVNTIIWCLSGGYGSASI